MSQGKFVGARYRANNNLVFSGRVQPETLELTLTVDGGTDLVNNQTTQPLTSGLPSYKVSKNANEIGIRPRLATFEFAADDQVPEGYKLGETYSLPIFVNTMWDAVGKGVTGTYLGKAIEYISRSPESVV